MGERRKHDIEDLVLNHHIFVHFNWADIVEQTRDIVETRLDNFISHELLYKINDPTNIQIKQHLKNMLRNTIK